MQTSTLVSFLFVAVVVALADAQGYYGNGYYGNGYFNNGYYGNGYYNNYPYNNNQAYFNNYQQQYYQQQRQAPAPADTSDMKWACTGSLCTFGSHGYSPFKEVFGIGK
ncbi:hypothetical protein AAVH_08290 [Aphelenchoides avenae]|nr:hypothetical protein AAVH_08290 [Aphelenchus avenae]